MEFQDQRYEVMHCLAAVQQCSSNTSCFFLMVLITGKQQAYLDGPHTMKAHFAMKAHLSVAEQQCSDYQLANVKLLACLDSLHTLKAHLSVAKQQCSNSTTC